MITQLPIDIDHLMDRLAAVRPIFHSEADFQFALAWELQKHYPKAIVRLERRFPGHAGTKSIYIDIWVELAGVQYPIELKYQTKALHTAVGSEVFELRSHGAEDNLGYDFLYDLKRIETFVESCEAPAVGHVILLANEKLWNNKPKANAHNKDAFRLYEGREITGSLCWGKIYPETVERHKPIYLTGNYKLEWLPYGTDLGFQYLHLQCTKETLEPQRGIVEIRDYAQP
jgi:hypothetical protein